MSIHNLSSRVSTYLARELGVDHSQEVRMGFGLELLLGDVIKLILILSIASLLGLFTEVLIIMITAALLRLAAGGEHCSAYYRCLIGGGLCFLLLGWVVHSLNPMLNLTGIYLIIGLSFLIAEIILWQYAPGDTENKPITGEDEKRKFKRWSLLIAFCYLLIMIILSLFNSTSAFVLPLAVGMLEEVFTVSPWGYRYMHFVDQVLDFGKWGGSSGGFEDSHRG